MPKRKKKYQLETLEDFLSSYTVPMLKKLATWLRSRLPTRKADLITLIREQMEDPARLRQLWEELDSLQRAAISEAVHARFDPRAFRAKHGGDPDWGQKSRHGLD